MSSCCASRNASAGPRPRAKRRWNATTSRRALFDSIFHSLATILGGFAWEKAGRIWYTALTRKLTKDATFQQCADATFEAAGELFGAGKAEQIATQQAWQAVGIA